MKRKHVCINKVVIAGLLGALLAACPTGSKPSAGFTDRDGGRI